MTRDGVRGGAAPVVPAAAALAPIDGDVPANATSGTRPRKYAVPLAPSAMSETREGSSVRRSPGALGAGSHTKVIFVFPFSARDVPIQVRTTRVRDGCSMPARAVSTGLGSSGLAGASARAVSAAVSAQYPLRARTCTPGRLARTLISWNRPSVGAWDEL